jgi:RNA recognition motif. (a.k.a. RRM, RBD, or RNP domain)
MSTNTTPDSRNSGDNRRRRTRGGQNRNNNHQEARQGGDRRSNDNRGQGRRQENNRSEEFRPQAPRPARVYSAPKLSIWQKILKCVGLYKEPTRPARPERQDSPARKNDEARAPKSNTRVARTNDGPPPKERQPRPERDASEERGPRPERQPRERSRGGNRDSVESARVYVGNLSYDVTEQDLQELFKGIGGVRNVEVVYNRSTHRSKGYGFIEMLHMDEAIRAVEVLHDQHFMGRKLTVSGAKSKGQDEREEKEDRPEREPRPIVVAPANRPAAEPAAIAEVAPIAVVEEVTAVSEPHQELETKYSFDAPQEVTEKA